MSSGRRKAEKKIKEEERAKKKTAREAWQSKPSGGSDYAKKQRLSEEEGYFYCAARNKDRQLKGQSSKNDLIKEETIDITSNPYNNTYE